MIWTQHQAELISDIYTLLEAASNPRIPQSEVSSNILPWDTPAVQSKMHRRSTSGASSSSEESNCAQYNQDVSRSVSMLVSPSDITSKTSSSAFVLDDLRDGGTGLARMSTAPRRSNARKRVSSTTHDGSKQAVGNDPSLWSQTTTTLENRTTGHMRHPPSLTIHDLDSLDLTWNENEQWRR